ncbi:hypothetical protein NQ315_003505 [Exocentrus adspersus]|uniref:Peptidase aspartic putative domain-containing protein n=1 Tax=Exocentrus adspersus TaxID=1586481 RepID=A0AAV8V7E2_9CUCU|nr:hypothetical protein NQ315_003505 [Exocentrus adspersus]
MAEKVKKVKILRDCEIGKLNDVLSSYDEAQTNAAAKSIFKARYQDINDIKSEFCKHNVILMNLVFQDEGELKDAVAISREFDAKFYKIKACFDDMFAADANSMLNSSASINAGAAGSGDKSAKLPKFDLIKFSGDITQFSTYIDYYNSSIHENESLSPISKFRYLISSLEGPPLKISRDIKIKSSSPSRIFSAIENLPKMTSKDPLALRNMLDVFLENLEALRTLEYPVDSWDFIMAHMLLDRTDNETLDRFDLIHDSEAMPTFDTLLKFLEKQCSSSSNMHTNKIKSPKVKSDSFHKNSTGFSRRPVPSSVSFVGIENKGSVKNCFMCSNPHPLYKCPEFLTLTPNERFQLAKNKNLCINCLSNIHKTSNCNSTSTCRLCQRRHHTMLHFDSGKVNNNSSTFSNISSATPAINNKPTHTNEFVQPSTSQTNLPSSVTSVTSCLTNSNTVVLATAVIEVVDVRGNFQKVRCLLDPGSQISFITSKCANQLGLPKQKLQTNIQGIGELNLSTQLGAVHLNIRPVGELDPKFSIYAVIVPKICTTQPNLADPNFFKPGPLDVLIGADLYPYIIQGGQITGTAYEPVAINTVFGFILMGKIVSPTAAIDPNFKTLCSHIEQQSLNNILQKFWELENIPQCTSSSLEDIKCEQIFTNTVSRNSDGRFIVTLPFKNDILPTFPSSKNLALNRFLALEQRLLKNPSLYHEYNQFLREYLDLNHMEILSTEDTYVDDIVTGCSTVDEALALKNELIHLCNKGGFELHKWGSNKSQLLANSSVDARNNAPSRSLDTDEITKVLGLLWVPSSDTFTYKVEPFERPCTKRNLLSELARVFDPLGLLSPITLFMKHLMQQLWVLGLNWDDEPPAEILNLWIRYKQELPLLSTINLRRHIDINFSQSHVALCWIKSHPYKWQPFVGNRVSYIQERIDPSDWYHVRSSDNPADIASRGAFPSALLNNEL